MYDDDVNWTYCGGHFTIYQISNHYAILELMLNGNYIPILKKEKHCQILVRACGILTYPFTSACLSGGYEYSSLHSLYCLLVPERITYMDLILKDL